MGELRAGADVLAELIERIEPRAIVAVGRSAERALGELGLPCDAAVRHPANGGATAFRQGLRRLRAVGALMVQGVADRGAQLQRAQHQHERDAADDGVRDDHGRLGAHREREQVGITGRAAQHDHDQRLLRAHAARCDGQEGRE